MPKKKNQEPLAKKVQNRKSADGRRPNEYPPKGGPYGAPAEQPPVRQASTDEVAKPKVAAEKVPLMHYGKFKGRPLAELPEWYLERVYAAFAKGRTPIEKELRARGFSDEALKRCKKRYRYLGKSPKKQVPEQEHPETTECKEAITADPSSAVPEGRPPRRKKQPVHPVQQSASQYTNRAAKRGCRGEKPKDPANHSAGENRLEGRAEALVKATIEKIRADQKRDAISLPDYVRQRRRK